MSTHPTNTPWTRDGAPALLNDDGTASMATLILSSHHGFRRDLSRLQAALGQLGSDPSGAEALKEAWQRIHETLHGHHHAEDEGMFPTLRAAHPELAPVFDRLTADHRRIDPLLEEGDRAFEALPETTGSGAAVVAALIDLLDPHLALEESRLIPHLRDSRQFPTPATEADLETYAQGFAWSLDGLAPEVQQQICAILPAALVSRLPAARAAFEAECERVWGPGRPTGASTTPVPDWTA